MTPGMSVITRRVLRGRVSVGDEWRQMRRRWLALDDDVTRSRDEWRRRW